jgi:hypothetical protein
MLLKGFGNRQPNRIGRPRIRLKVIRVSKLENPSLMQSQANNLSHYSVNL